MLSTGVKDMSNRSFVSPFAETFTINIFYSHSVQWHSNRTMAATIIVMILSSSTAGTLMILWSKWGWSWGHQ